MAKTQGSGGVPTAGVAAHGEGQGVEMNGFGVNGGIEGHWQQAPSGDAGGAPCELGWTRLSGPRGPADLRSAWAHGT